MNLEYNFYADTNKKNKEAFNDSTLIGNGFMGASIYGHPYNEKIILNEDSFWLGKNKRKRENKDFYHNYFKIKELVNSEKIKEAERLLALSAFSSPQGEAIYSVAGQMNIEFLNKEEISNYKRYLNLDEAVSYISYNQGDNLIKREAFASNKDMVIAFKIEALKPISFDISLDREKLVDRIDAKDNIITLLYGYNKHDKLVIMARVISDGDVETIGSNIVVSNSKKTYIYVALRTTFYSKNPYSYCKKRISNCEYDILKERHILDYQCLYNKNSLSTSNKTVDELYAFARYLMISSSRVGSNPANLQGLWCQDIFPSWDSKYTININLEMNYWFIFKSNLIEESLPVFDLLKRIHRVGKRLAKNMYHAKGYCAFHNSDIYGDCAPQDKYLPATYWPFGGAWLALMVWEYYSYTNDISFLKKNYYLLKDACEFFKEVLEKNEEGYYVLNPSLSPENSYYLNGDICHIAKGTTMDREILYDLFSSTVNATKVLNMKIPDEYINILNNLPPFKISKYNTICEWNEDYEEAEPGHRHISQLYGLYPSNQINEQNKELFLAAKNTIERRLSNGGGHTGWSKAWIISMFARLNEGQKAFVELMDMKEKSISKGYLDLHPPFQIDGNFGIAAAICEMLIREEDGKIILLPALPQELSSGEFKGVRIKGNVTLDMKWEDSYLKEVVIEAYDDIDLNIVCNKTKCQIKSKYHLKKNSKIVIK